jgi:hypothetical protein
MGNQLPTAGSVDFANSRMVTKGAAPAPRRRDHGWIRLRYPTPPKSLVAETNNDGEAWPADDIVQVRKDVDVFGILSYGIGLV